MIQSLIAQYGYLAIFVGTFLEGETVVILAGFAAHRGYLQLPWVITAACAGTLFGDQLFFYLGRRHSARLLAWRPQWQPRLQRAMALIHRQRVWITLGFRFVYGLRTITPFALGMSGVPLRVFVPLNFLGALIWGVCFGFAGYLFGQAVEVILGDVKRYEYGLFALLVAVGVLVWSGARLWNRRGENRSGKDQQ